MRHSSSVFLALLFGLFFFSCKKNSPQININEALIGSWELRQTYGGLAGTTTNYPPGNGNIIKFDGTNFLSNSNPPASYTYKVIQDTFRLNGQISNRLVLNNRLDLERIFIDITNNLLSITYDAVDAGTSVYARIQ